MPNAPNGHVSGLNIGKNGTAELLVNIDENGAGKREFLNHVRADLATVTIALVTGGS